MCNDRQERNKETRDGFQPINEGHQPEQDSNNKPPDSGSSLKKEE